MDCLHFGFHSKTDSFRQLPRVRICGVCGTFETNIINFYYKSGHGFSMMVCDTINEQIAKHIHRSFEHSFFFMVGDLSLYRVLETGFVPIWLLFVLVLSQFLIMHFQMLRWHVWCMYVCSEKTVKLKFVSLSELKCIYSQCEGISYPFDEMNRNKKTANSNT